MDMHHTTALLLLLLLLLLILVLLLSCPAGGGRFLKTLLCLHDNGGLVVVKVCYTVAHQRN
jgi:hypothetical protein